MIILYLIPFFLIAIFSFSFWLSNQILFPPPQPLTSDPSGYDLIFEEISFQSTDRLGLKGWWIPAGDSAPTVILLHPLLGNRQGLFAHRKSYPEMFRIELDLLKIAQVFHQAGWTVMTFDFRSHGESQPGLCAGGLTEDQDVTGAVDFAFRRQSAFLPEGKTPQVGLVGFGLGALAAFNAIGRTKGKAEKLMVFTGDSEGGSGWTEIQPPNNKLLSFLIAVEPATMKFLLRECLGKIAPVFIPLVNWLCQLRGGYPLDGTDLLKAAQEVHLPVLFVMSMHETSMTDHQSMTYGQMQVLYDALPGSKRIEEMVTTQMLLDFASTMIRK